MSLNKVANIQDSSIGRVVNISLSNIGKIGGSGGGGGCGPEGSLYRAGSGGSGIVIIRYPI